MTTLKNMRRSIVLATATAALLAASGCGGNSDVAPSGGVSPAASAPTTKAASAPARPRTVTSACQLLPADVVVTILGSSKGTTLEAKEQPPQDEDARRYNCVYGAQGQELLSLVTTTYPDRADTVAETIDAIAKSSQATTTRIDGVGADAVVYTSDDVRVLAFAMPYEKELRVSVLTGPSIIPQTKYTELARQVASRL
ncbi:hypothetical protein ACFP2T_33335 [Plantactinospora solaniradicis]|uniref:DUF3558 domain-containing protein n=1 Tax=Plantactinospora solaniradicis TaxID=1723736 RepID=A0ABW1KJP7_9ACTN